LGTCSWLFLGLQESERAGTSGADDDSDAESDGYGAEGLSWEAVMESLQVQGSVSPNNYRFSLLWIPVWIQCSGVKYAMD
jgi:hypothetical protein